MFVRLIPGLQYVLHTTCHTMPSTQTHTHNEIIHLATPRSGHGLIVWSKFKYSMPQVPSMIVKTWRLLIILSCYFSCRALSLSSSSPSSSSSSSCHLSIVPNQTPTDRQWDEEWCPRFGIQKVGCQTCTTPISVGGRGLFATRNLSAGTVICSIPERLVLVVDGSNKDNNNKQPNEWQVALTNQVLEHLTKKENGNDRNKNDSGDDDSLLMYNQWIASWKGSGPLKVFESLLGDNVGNKDKEEIESSIHAVAKWLYNDQPQHVLSLKSIQQDLHERFWNFQTRRPFLGLADDDNNNSKNDQVIAEWYSLVMSRASYLGKDWDYRVGIVPFFDMLNHSHDAELSNVELKTVGQCLRGDGSYSSEDEGKNYNNGDDDVKNGADRLGLNRRDLVLVLTKPVREGQELLTQYETNVDDDEEAQLKLWIQYGIPPPTTTTVAT